MDEPKKTAARRYVKWFPRKKGFMRFTVRDFAKSVGLEPDGSDYIAATIMLKFLCRKGIAKEADRINTAAKGRKSVVFEVPETFTISLQTPQATPLVVVTPVAPVEEEPVVVTGQFHYDYGDDEDEAA
jgi:hypothetical protein